MAEVLMGQEKSGIFAAVPACGEPSYARAYYWVWLAAGWWGRAAERGTQASRYVRGACAVRRRMTARLGVACVETRFIASLTARMVTRWGRNVEAGLRPERVRCDESRLYVADFPCGRKRVMISHGGALPRVGRRYADSEAVDPIGVALSITAGKRSAPADRNHTPLRPHRGRTSRRRRADRGLLRADLWSWTPMGSSYL